MQQLLHFKHITTLNCGLIGCIMCVLVMKKTILKCRIIFHSICAAGDVLFDTDFNLDEFIPVSV